MFKMQFKIMLFVFIAIIYPSNGVKVNMQGSLILGKDIMEALTQYLKINYVSGRRTMSTHNERNEAISSLVKSAFLCHKLVLCNKGLKTFVEDYVYTVDCEIERIFEDLKNNNQVDEENPIKLGSDHLVFKDHFKVSLKNIKKILKNANEKISEENEASIWTGVIKKISAKFLETVQWFVDERIEGSSGTIEGVKRKLSQDLITSIVSVEDTFQTKLCSEHNICMKSHECTNGLNLLLLQFNNTAEEKVKNFVRTFYELLPETGFYNKLKEATATEFQVILNDMSYGTVVTKDVFMALQKTVEGRLKSEDNNTDASKEKDVALLHIILSDMDHIYSKSKPEPFYKFLNSFNDWVKFGGRLNPHVKTLMKDIEYQISLQPAPLVDKLTNEVKTFLEITVDPEK